MYKTIAQLRNAFWEVHPEFKEHRRSRKRHNDYNADIRSAFSEWKDLQDRDGLLTDHQAQNATL